MKIVCCANMPYAKEAFSTLGETLVKDGRKITADDVRDADILAIRSTTMANKALLKGSRVKFVGTATIGTDHMDTAWFDSAGIKWCYAAGCNANSVSEYLTSALLCLADRHNLTLKGRTIGVIGVGNVGGLVVKKAETLGMKVRKNDPPRQRSEVRGQRSEIRGQREGEKEGWTGLDELLPEADVVTLHVPLTKTGQDATFHMADEKFFAKMKPGCIFINCARGAVVETDVLLKAMDKGIVSHTVIDTWEGEPKYRQDLLDRVDLGTPHIAGHSFEGKVMGTVMVYEEVCRFLGVKPTWTIEGRWPPPLVPEVNVDATGKRDEKVLWEIVRSVYDIQADDRRMRDREHSTLDTRHPTSSALAAHFDRLRREYPMRREFRFTKVLPANASEELRRKVVNLGFCTG